jgi:hypothetical protein
MSRISPVQLGASVRKFNLNRPFICPILDNRRKQLFRPVGGYFANFSSSVSRVSEEIS